MYEYRSKYLKCCYQSDLIWIEISNFHIPCQYGLNHSTMNKPYSISRIFSYSYWYPSWYPSITYIPVQHWLFHPPITNLPHYVYSTHWFIWVSIYCDVLMMTNAHELMMSSLIFLHLVLRKLVSMGWRTITFFSFFHISTIQISNWNCHIQGWVHTFTNIVLDITHRYLLLALPCKARILCW
jgi:hypothetical protein